MSGHVTRKDGKIVEFPERVNTIFKWLAGIAISVPAAMLLSGLADPGWVFPTWAAIVLAILPFGLIVTAMVAMLRKGQGGIVAFATIISLMHLFSMRVEPLTDGMLEMLLTRGIPLLAVVVTLVFLRLDLRYNLRPFWYSAQAMRDLQEAMMMARAKKDAKKRGETFDEKKVMDAEAVVRAVQAQTGMEIPKSMSGINVKPGFRQESKHKDSGGGTGRKFRKRRGR